MADTDPAYIAVEPCGCVTACHVDRPEYAKDIAHDLSEWILSGRRIERTTVADARSRFSDWPCEHAADASSKTVSEPMVNHE